jgi:Arc/MetJ family transcription regulator
VRTTLEIDDGLLEDVVKLSGEKNKRKAVNAALAEYVRRRKLQDLRKLIGTLDLDDDWWEREEQELNEMRKLYE